MSPELDPTRAFAVLKCVEGNAPALRAVLEDAAAQDCTQFCALGNVVGFIPLSDECIELASGFQVVVRGFYEQWCCRPPDARRGVVTSPVKRALAEHVATTLSAPQREWLLSRPGHVRCAGVAFVGWDQLLEDAHADTPWADAPLRLGWHMQGSFVPELVYRPPGAERGDETRRRFEGAPIERASIGPVDLEPGHVTATDAMGVARYCIVTPEAIVPRAPAYDARAAVEAVRAVDERWADWLLTFNEHLRH